MKIIVTAAAALALSGSALAYQYHTTHATTNPDPQATATITVDPTVAITPVATWNEEQRALWAQQMAYHPGWTAAQRAEFAAMMAMPPVNWTAEQRMLYQEHLSHIPPTWTTAQRAMFESQIASLRTPWLSATQTALTTTPVGPRVVQPSNANPERDARGIAVISDPAVVPDGYNGFAGTAMGGPFVDPVTGETIDAADASYPACTASVTDNCIQLYERGVRRSAVGGPIEGEDEAGDNTPEDDALDIDTKPDGTLDVDGDLDGDGDNDIE